MRLDDHPTDGKELLPRGAGDRLGDFEARNRLPVGG